MQWKILLVTFHHCGKIPKRNKLKGGKIYFGSQFQCMMADSIVSGSVMRQNIMAEWCYGTKLLLGGWKQRERRGP
jgi:hypothetical protein